VTESASLFERVKQKPVRLLPDSIFGQILFVLVAGLALLQIANFLVVCGVQKLYVDQMERARIEHVVSYRALFESIPADLRAETLNAAHGNPALAQSLERVTIVRERPDWTAPGPILADSLGALKEALSAGGETPDVLVRGEGSESLLPLHAPTMEVAVALTDGTWLTILFPVEADDRLMVWSQRLFVFLEALVLLVPLVYLLKRVTNPIDRLCGAAEAFGAAPEESPALPEEGPRELRSAANAFNRMREQIRGHLDERNRMIAALAHDLRTPLTKLQLRLARVEPETLRDQLVDTAKGMNAILTQGLEFARSLRTEEPMTKIDLPSFLQSLADDYADLGHAVTFECDSSFEENPQKGVLPARPLCLKRCMENLLTNACAYGGSAAMQLTLEKNVLVVTVSDRGPGIPEELMEKVFEPYFRVEGSRNRASGGTGLGLPIAKNMAQLNGGTLTLANRPEGGLTVTLRLRLSAAG
jgi:signal transduction histidine kinase